MNSMEEKRTVQESTSQTKETPMSELPKENQDWKYKLLHVGKIMCYDL